MSGSLYVIHQFRKLMIHFAKHAHYKFDLIQTHVIFLHIGIKSCQNWSVTGPGGYTIVHQLHCLLGGTGRLFYAVTIYL